MDISIQYSDSTQFPLEKVDVDDYVLDVSTLNHYVIGMAPYVKPYQPRFVALGQGHGELLKVMLKLGSDCSRKRSRSLTVSYVVVDSDFSPANRVYNDPYLSDGHYDDNRANRRDPNIININKKPFYNMPAVNAKDKHEATDDKFGRKFQKSDQGDSGVIPIGIDLAENLRSNDGPLTKQEPIRQEELALLSPLEIGMYVLLAVFCVPISVFLVHCIVFMVRYKRKRVPKGKGSGSETVAQANDWVWIGRATLERNAINTKCSQTLMPAEDFNGNHTPVAGGSSHNGSGQNSAEASNRSSFVSTIKGSECSIRITANPLLDASSTPSTSSEDNNNQHHQLQQPLDPEWDYEAMGMTYDQLVDYFDNLKESTA